MLKTVEGIDRDGRIELMNLPENVGDRYPDEDSIRSVRRLWINAGWHPPITDPILA